MSALNSLVSEAIDLVVHCTRGPDGPRVTEVVAVEDLVSGPESTHFTVTPLFERRGYDQPLAWTRSLPNRALRALHDAGFDGKDLLAGGQPSPPTTEAGHR